MSMKRGFLAVLAMGTLGCAPQGQAAGYPVPSCAVAKNIGHEYIVQLSVLFDRHGQIAEVEGCPEQDFAVNFSQSNLYDKKLEPLLSSMVLSVSTDRRPIKMKIRGVSRRIEATNGIEIIVKEILVY